MWAALSGGIKFSVRCRRAQKVCIIYNEMIIMNPCELTASVTALANMLAGKMNNDELNLWGAVLTQLGDTLTTIAAQRSLCENSSHPAEQ